MPFIYSHLFLENVTRGVVHFPQIPHHAGAVAMCDILSTHAEPVHPHLETLCAGIVAGQQAEIAWMLSWLDRNAPEHHASSVGCSDEGGYDGGL